MKKMLKIIGLLIAALAMLYFGYNILEGTNILEQTNRFYVSYDNTDGLAKGSPVKINGVKVGRVFNVRFQPDEENVLVTFDIQGDIKLGENTVAELTSDGLLGGKAIFIKRKKSKKYLSSGAHLKPKVDKGLSEIIESAQPITDNIQITIRRVNEILLGLEGFGELLNNTVYNMDSVLSSVLVILKNNDKKINDGFSNFEQITHNINLSLVPLNNTLKNLEYLSDTLKNTPFANTLYKTNTLLDQLNATLKNLEKKNSTLGKLMYEDSLHNQLSTMLQDLDKLLIHFNQYPRDFMAPLGRKHHKLKGIKETDN